MKKTICFYGVWAAILVAYWYVNYTSLLSQYSIDCFRTFEGFVATMKQCMPQAIVLSLAYLYTENKILLKKTYITRPERQP